MNLTNEKKLLREHIFISLCGIFYFLAGCILINSAYPSIPEISLVFWSTLLVYFINTKVKINFLNASSFSSIRPPFSKKAKMVLLLSTITLFHIPFLTLGSLIFLVHLGLISTLYNVPEKTGSKFHIPIRSIPILKVFLIAYVWASLSSFFPAIVGGKQMLNVEILVIFGAHFLFIISITLPFDIRDFKADRSNALITFPHLIGIIPSKMIAVVCLAGFTWLIRPSIPGWYFILFVIITTALIVNSSMKRKKYYFTYFVDGTIMLYFIVILLSL